MTAPAPGHPWWRDAVVYQVYVRSFADGLPAGDGAGDGIGDLPGITARLPYLRDLGVDALWITPFYTSPQKDHGYDVADYTDVDPLFGRLADVDRLLETAHDLGLRVIVDLVPNHTSDQHAWFRAALAAGPGSPERARYLFRPGRGEDGAEPPNNWDSVFGGPAWTRVPDEAGSVAHGREAARRDARGASEASPGRQAPSATRSAHEAGSVAHGREAARRDARGASEASPGRQAPSATRSAHEAGSVAHGREAARRDARGASEASPGRQAPSATRSAQKAQWYLHLFDASQPDLDWRNPEVGDLFEDVLRFWLDRGVDGFRVDVAHGLYKEAALRDQVRPEKQAKTAGSMVERVLVDEPMWDQPEVHDVYRRWRRVLDSYPGDRMAVAEAWTQTAASMARFVRPDELHQAFNFGWLGTPWSATAFAQVINDSIAAVAAASSAPTWVLSNHDVERHPTRYGGGPVGLARARAATLTMLALPGSAYLYQGEELGLEQVDVPPEARQDPSWFRTGLPGRDGCRVPLPWSGDRPPYGFGGPAGSQPWIPQPDDWAPLSVEAQLADPDSTLAFYQRALAARRAVFAGAEESTRAVADDELLVVLRGDVAVVLNAGSESAPLPAGEVLISSGPVPDGLLPPDTAAWIR
ncbi:glycoside hydrolase family 13 protein [Nocardioides sp. L-11A]|uniref:glycoside hydrolase family 13 protein n=1 Tax=Nocardioides sp. L-11A TaxID=3043848 RepID=UPI00249BB3CF|nr:alpha-amylase family glycosyl hydrolase [Nocardioides sp. L-11A]